MTLRRSTAAPGFARALALACALAFAVGGTAGFLVARELGQGRADEAALHDHLLFLIEATAALDRAPDAPRELDRLVARFYAESIRQTDRLTARGARGPEPWTSIHAFARQVERTVERHGLDAELADRFHRAALRLAEESS